MLEITFELKFLYLYMYYEILIYWVPLAHFSLTLPLIRQSFFLFLLFFALFPISLKPKLFYQYFFESLRKQQLRGILLNIYVFNLIHFTKLCSLFAIFVNTQETFQRGLNVVVISMLILTTSDDVKTMLLFSTSSFITLINVETTMRIWLISKSWKEQKNIFELQKKDDSSV